MSNPLEYMIAVETSPEALIASVNSYTTQGWHPLGGVACEGGDVSNPNLYQALVKDMAKPVWVVRGGETGQHEQWALANDCVVIDWEVGDLREYGTSNEITETLLPLRGRNRTQAENGATELWHFANEIAVGDFVVMPFKNSEFCAVGRIVGGYRYVDEKDHWHQISVKWAHKKTAKTRIPHSLTNQQAVSQIRKDHAEVARVMAILTTEAN